MKDNLPTILITGANGQLGNAFREIATQHPSYQFLFTTKEEMPVDNESAVNTFFEQHIISCCINCAAYTAVDKAETEKEKAFLVNATAVGNLAKICKQHGARLIHISTDYVFDGSAKYPYKETDSTSPISTYGESKLKGEELALQNDPSTIIIRSSWIYSHQGNNFVKTMLRLMKEKESLNVVNDQFGCPTYAPDLADAIMQLIPGNQQSDTDNQKSAIIFNFCNSGITTWYQFALAIKELTESNCILNPIPTSSYPTAARRPQYSVLDTTKIREILNNDIPFWKDSLQKCLQILATDDSNKF